MLAFTFPAVVQKGDASGGMWLELKCTAYAWPLLCCVKFWCLISGGMRFVSKEAVCKQGDESDMEDGDGSDGDDEDDEDAESGDDEGAQLIPPRSAKHCDCLWSSATGLSCLMLGD